MLYCERLISVYLCRCLVGEILCGQGLLRISKKHDQGLLLIKRYFLGVHGEPGRSENERWRYRAESHQIHRQDYDFTEKIS
jgi:hypothetical protein